MPRIYKDEFSDWADVSRDFGSGSWDARTIGMDEPEHVFAAYEAEGYEGSALVLYAVGGKLYSVEGSHCSCYGLEDQWDPNEETPETAVHQASKSDYGLWQRYSAEILQWLAAQGIVTEGEDPKGLRERSE